MNIFIGVLCAVLMIFGVTELVRVLVFCWIRPETAKDFSIVVVPENAESCEYTVRAAAERMKWLDFKGPCRLICVNRDSDPEIDRICRFLALKYPYLQVSKTEDLVYHIVEEHSE